MIVETILAVFYGKEVEWLIYARYTEIPAREGDGCKESTEHDIDGAQEDVQQDEMENAGWSHARPGNYRMNNSNGF